MAQDIRAGDSGSGRFAAPAEARPASANGPAPSANRSKSVEQRLRDLERSNAQLGRELKAAKDGQAKAERSLRGREETDQQRLNEWLASASDEEIGRYYKQQAQARSRPAEPDEDTAERFRREGREAAEKDYLGNFEGLLKKNLSADSYQEFIEAVNNGETTLDDLRVDWASSRSPAKRRAAATMEASMDTEVPSALEGESGEIDGPVTAETLRSLKGQRERGSQIAQKLLDDPKTAEDILSRPW